MKTSVAVPARRTRRIAFRILGAVALLLIALLAVVTACFYAAARATLPQVDGHLALSGLKAPVTVARDAQGVPNISAASLEDLFFAQGYLTAQDRLWQMDMTRRYAAGELAEVLGRKYVEHDRQQRTLLIRQAVENATARLSPRDRAHFEAYARGVNARIEEGHLPVEFRVLHYRPRPWTPSDSLLVAASMVQMLNFDSLPHKLAREKISAHLSPQMAAELFPNSSWRDHPPVSLPGQDEFVPLPGDQAQPAQEQEEGPQPKNEPAQPAVPRPRRRRARPQQREIRKPARRHHRGRMAALQTQDSQPATRSSQPATHNSQLAGNWQLATDNLLRPGSNNWVISGTHTASGKPLLSNDMHLAHHIPNVWYEAHLTSGAYDVAGVTLPGLPYVIVGHNQRIAWGFTNIGPAVTDLFVEAVNVRGEYQTPEGWRPVGHRSEVIHVRGGLDQTVDVAITRHGPIISALFSGETRQLALKWTIYDPAAMQVPLFELNSAQNWDEFRNALSRFGSPAQNVVYADVDGHIGYQATGMVPVRASGDGSLPVPGNNDAHEWTSYVRFDKLPSSFDPPSGVIATANSRITPDGYPYIISNEWSAPYRTDRIYHVLTENRLFTPADMLALQTDIYSEFDRFCAERFVYALDHASAPSARGHQAAEMMRAWDGRMTTDSAAATIVSASRYELKRLLLADKLGDAWKEYQWFMSSVWLEDMILRQPPEWLPAKYADWNALLAASVEAAIDGKDSTHNLNDWRWGRQEPVNLQHPLFGMVPLLRRWTGTGRFDQSGNGYTVKQVGSRFGPSERMTVDFSNLDGSTLNIVTGQSGQIFSPHYMDQWRAWYEGRTFPLPFTSTAVQRNAKHMLVLEPK